MHKQFVEFTAMGRWSETMKILVSANEHGDMVVEEDAMYPYRLNEYDPGMRYERSSSTLDCTIHRPDGGWFRRGDVIKVQRWGRRWDPRWDFHFF